MKTKFIKAHDLKKFINCVLLKAGVRHAVAVYVAEGLVQTSLRGVDSHGVRLFAHYVAALKAGRINPRPEYKFKKTSPSTAILDADHTFGHAAGMEAVKRAMRLADKAGTGHVAVYNSTHFGAAAYYALEIAKHDMIGMSFTHADSLVRAHASKKAFFGTNPICFAAPCKGEEPFCLDMATSIYNFNKIKQLRQSNVKVPQGIGADRNGVETTDPHKITMLLPIGGYKGYGLSMMVEILCGMLSGMPYGPYIPSMYKAPIHEKRYLGHFFSAIRIDCFQDKDVFKKRLSKMINELRKEQRLDKKIPVQIAGDPEKKYFSVRSKNGIPVVMTDYEIFKKISCEYGVKLR